MYYKQSLYKRLKNTIKNQKGERMRHLNKDNLYRLTSKVEDSIYRVEPFRITDVGELLALQEALRLLNILLQNGQINIDE